MRSVMSLSGRLVSGMATPKDPAVAIEDKCFGHNLADQGTHRWRIPPSCPF